MRKGIYIWIVLAICTSLLFSGGYATEWLTNRESIEVSSGTVDLNITDSNLYMPAGGASSDVLGNISLPCNIANLSVMNFTIENKETIPITVNLTVNGVALLSSYSLTSGGTITKTLNDYQTAGGDTSLAYIAWSFNANQTDDEWLNITVTADNATLLASWINSKVKVYEQDQSTPQIKTEMIDSFFTVKDKVVVSNSFDYTLYNLSLNLTYPSHAISRPYNSILFSSVANNSISVKYIGYQKRGPYIKDMELTNDGNEYALEVRVYSYETLIDCVDWIIDTEDESYAEYFTNFDPTTLEITEGNTQIDYTYDNGTITIEDLSLVQGYTEYTFTWTYTPPVTPSVTPSTTTEAPEISMFPLMMVLIILVLAIMAVYMARRR